MILLSFIFTLIPILAQSQTYDVIIRNGRSIDSSGNPAQLSVGVKYVFVNGQLEYEDGKMTGAMAGKALRRNGAPNP